MSSRSAAGVIALLAVVLAVAWAASRIDRRAAPLGETGAPRSARGLTGDWEAARARLATFPSYRALFERRAVRDARLLDDGRVVLEIDPRTIARPLLRRLGWPELEDALPASATATVGPSAEGVAESWRFACPGGCLLDAFASGGTGAEAGAARDAIPGDPELLATFRLDRARISDLAIGGRAREALVQRADLVERILGRAVRETLADDLAGSGVVAFYVSASGRDAAVLALDLRRTDRLRALMDLTVGLAALTRGATVRRYRDVAVGSWSGPSGAGFAVAIDGPVLLAASDASRLDDAIDRRRDPLAGGLARPAADPPSDSVHVSAKDGLDARLVRDGAAWRLEARGKGPLAEEATLKRWLLAARGARQRDGD